MYIKAVLPIIGIILFFSCTSKEAKEQGALIPASQSGYKFSQVLIKEHSQAGGAAFMEYNKYHNDGPVIPGLYQGAIPQGLAYDPESSSIFITNYMFNGKPSSLSVISMPKGKFEKVLWLENPDGTPHTGHTGGVAASRKNLWIASGKGVYRVKLSTALNAPADSNLQMEEFIPTAVKASFAAISGNILWIGEFTSKDGSYSTPDSHHVKITNGQINHAWMAGYILDGGTDTIKSGTVKDGKLYPDYILSIPDEVQGAAFWHNIIVLSLSYGRRNKSHLKSFKNPFVDKTFHPQPGTFKLSGETSIPFAVIDGSKPVHSLTIPPMSEGLTLSDGELTVIFESGSDKYRSTALLPQGKIQLFPIGIFTK